MQIPEGRRRDRRVEQPPEVRQPGRARLSSSRATPSSRSTRTSGKSKGLKAYASVLDVPGPIDMASFYVPPEIGERVIERGRRASRSPEVWLNPGAESDALIARARPFRSSRSSRAASSRSAGTRTRCRQPIPQQKTSMPSHHKRHGAGAHDQRARHDRPRRDCHRHRIPAAPKTPKPQQAGAPGGLEHHRSEGHEHPEAHADRQGHERRRRHRHAQAGADLPDPEGADRAERLHLLGRRARSAAGRLRLPARARLQLPAGPRRHLRVAVADPQVRSADRRHGLGPDSSAEGRGALLRADQGRGGQLRGARPGARQAVLREPDAALPAGAAAGSRPPPTTSPAASWT